MIVLFKDGRAQGGSRCRAASDTSLNVSPRFNVWLIGLEGASGVLGLTSDDDNVVSHCVCDSFRHALERAHPPAIVFG